MKVDVVIGNPPYQYKTQSIYHLFIEKALDISNGHVEMIVKNNWLASDTIKYTRDRMVNSGLKEIVNYPVVGEVFTGLDVAVSIVHIDKDYSGDTRIKNIESGEVKNIFEYNFNHLPVVFRDRLDCSIVGKIRTIMSDSFESQIYPTECFRITSNLGVGRGSKRYDLEFSTDRSEDSVEVICLDGSVYTDRDKLPEIKHDLVDCWKVICGKILLKNDKVITGLRVVPDNTVCTSSFGVLYADKNKNRAYNAYSYIKTKFFRYLANLMCDDGVIAVSPYRFSLVPMVDLDKPWTDEELYRKFGLSDEEVRYIESKTA